ncbi:hypothetical protein [Parasitella parasitica]|uniref:Uncharacterized protein n=1 Tax=Parasitella parasitica TaxID=35722 RepID=A0A0B7NKF6_9FUNG|nr:hypothetical protein [Parasitella parasitica]
MDDLPDYTDSDMEGVTVNGSSSLHVADDVEAALNAADEADDELSDDEGIEVDDSSEDEDEEASNIRLIDTKYKTSGVIEDGSDDLACVYDCTSMENVGPNSYTTFKLISIGFNARIVNGPQVERMMQQRTMLSAQSHDVSENSCKLYNLEDEATEYKYCSHSRFDSSNSNKPFQKMKVMVIGDIISRLIANPVTREELRYRHNFDADHRDDEQPDDELDRIIIRNLFDAKKYQNIRNTYFRDEYDIGICIQNDGLNTPDNLVIRLRVHCLVAGGDIPAVFDWSCCAYHSSEYGCRICYSKGVHLENKPHGFYFPDTVALEDYREANSSLGYNGVSLFTQFSSFSGPQMFSLEELHLLCRGVSSQMLQLLTVLKDIGKQIEKTRSFIPVAFDGAFQDIVQKIRGTRAVDYLDIALYIIPTLFVPEMTNSQAAKAIMKLTRGISLSLQWELTERTLNEIDACIGKYGDLITARVRTNAQASNLIESVAIRNHLKLTFDANEFLQGIRPRPYSNSSFRDHPQSLTDAQLWEPFESFRLANEGAQFCLQGVSIPKIKRALTKFYCRLYSVQRLQPDYPSISLTLTVAHRVLLKSSLIVSERYQDKIREYRRGNHFVMFNSNHLNHLRQVMSCWYVGSILFFFEHEYNHTTYFLAFVEVMKQHRAAAHDRSIPFVRMNRPLDEQIAAGANPVIGPKYIVIAVDDITLQVGLVQSMSNELDFSVVGNYHTFDQDMSRNAGSIVNL